MKKHGHYCKVCGEYKANEKFSGKGHATHICKACAQLPPEEQAERREAEERLRALVESMEEPDRTLFLRYYYEEEPLDQVCRALQMRPSTARSRLCRGRRKLKERLTQEGGMLDAQSHP